MIGSDGIDMFTQERGQLVVITRVNEITKGPNIMHQITVAAFERSSLLVSTIKAQILKYFYFSLMFFFVV